MRQWESQGGNYYWYRSENYRIELVYSRSGPTPVASLYGVIGWSAVFIADKPLVPLQVEIILQIGPLAFLRKWLKELRREGRCV